MLADVGNPTWTTSTFLLSSTLLDVDSEVFFFVKNGTDGPQPWGLLCNPVMKMVIFFVFPCNRSPVEWHWQGKTKILGEEPVPEPLCPPQIPHGLPGIELGNKQLIRFQAAMFHVRMILHPRYAFRQDNFIFRLVGNLLIK